jgi:RNA polymerase sigma-70 factor (ECF subfamily)
MEGIAVKTMVSDFHFTKEEILQEEEEIKAAVKDPAQFAVLYNRYYVKIYRYIYNRVNSEELAADVTQQAFIKAMQSLAGYRFMGLPFASWLYRIARNELLIQLRQKNKMRTVNISDHNVGEVADEIHASDNPDLMRELVQAMRHLNDEEVELIEMKYFEGRQYQEICEVLGINENNAKSKIFRAVRKLRKLVNNAKG